MRKLVATGFTGSIIFAGIRAPNLSTTGRVLCQLFSVLAPTVSFSIPTKWGNLHIFTFNGIEHWQSSGWYPLGSPGALGFQITN